MAKSETIFDRSDEAVEAAAIAKARAEIAAGEGIPHEVVGVWLRRLAGGESDLPPPIT